VRDLSSALDTPVRKAPSLRLAYVIPALVFLLLAAAASVWFYLRSEKRHWAREQAIPKIGALTGDNKPLAALLLLRQAEQVLPGDPELARISASLTHRVSVHSSPAGALVEIKDYLSPDDPWFALGATPLENIQIPNGYFRWRVSKAGMAEYDGAPITADIKGPRPEFKFPLDALAVAPQGMVPVPATAFTGVVWSLGMVGPFDLPPFYIDRYEVTNSQYQKFVDEGGYRKPEYWKQKFLLDGRELTWQQAMDRFRDSTSRTGPATWESGHCPAGHENDPVSGVSWYEAAAYAEFAGKSLPVIAQWFLAADSSIAKYVTRQSNFHSTGVAPAGKYAGLGPFGTYDMAGNVQEWCWNDVDGHSRYILGGAWNTSDSDYYEPGNQQPFTRTAINGFRCVRNMAPVPALATARQPIKNRDFSKARPASDEVFQIYRTMYAYQHTALNAKVEPVPQDSADWHKEKITFDAAYGNERMTAYLLVPLNVRPPYQTVVYSPSAKVLFAPDSHTLVDMKFIDYIVKSGRAILYPVYKGTYDRREANPDDDSPAAERENWIHQYKDMARSLDYLETRADFDRNKIGYVGESMGAAIGVILAALDPRIKAVVLQDGGFFEGDRFPGVDQADFAPRLKTPVLMVSGKYDWVFMGKDALFRMLGAPAADKKAETFDTAHDVSEQRADLMRVVLAWLDKYLGRV
jgi:eukaryotic-like serine/threonine-protein kinase